eukprot:jgi/Botrbrau1/16723/Bobra.0276s0003.1
MVVAVMPQNFRNRWSTLSPHPTARSHRRPSTHVSLRASARSHNAWGLSQLDAHPRVSPTPSAQTQSQQLHQQNITRSCRPKAAKLVHTGFDPKDECRARFAKNDWKDSL